MEKYASFSTEESLQQRIDLHMNFRSRAQVLDFCNDIFYKIMSPDLGRVAYDRDAALYYGAKNYDENAKGFKPEILLLDEKVSWNCCQTREFLYGDANETHAVS